MRGTFAPPMPTCKASGQKSQLAEERLSPIRDKEWSRRPLRRFATAGSGMVAGRTDGVGLRKRPRSSSRKQPREAAKIQMKRGGRLSERARASRDWNEWLFWEFDGTVVSLSHCVLCGGRRTSHIFHHPPTSSTVHLLPGNDRTTAAANDDSGEGSDIRVRSFVRGSLSLQRY